MGAFVSNLSEIWRRMGLVQRVVLVGVVGAMVAAAALLVGWARQPEMVLLWGELDPAEAAEIAGKIRERDVAMELRHGGTSIFVPAEEVVALRVDLAAEGLPTGGVRGYSLLDEERIGASPFTQKINYRRAREGELARTIMGLDGVAGARIHIVEPETRLFKEGEKSASATVVLRLTPGWRLAGRQAAAITQIMAAGVANLSASDVVIVDGAGNLLAGGKGDTFAAGAGTLLDYKSRVEEYLARKAEDMLGLALGPGRATVKVDATIETQTVNQTVETYDPENKVPSKEELTTKSETQPLPAPEGPGAPGPAGASTREETTLTDYLVSRTVEQTVHLPGRVVSLTVAAFVDLSSPPPSPEAAGAGAEGAAPEGLPTPPAPALEIKDIEDIIRNAVGLKETDTLKVVATPFARPPVLAGSEPETTDLLADAEFYLDLARHGSLGVLVIGALLALKIFGGARRKAVGAGEGVAGAVAGGQMNLLAGGGPALGDPEELKHRIAAALQDNPDEVKRLFKAWVEGDEGDA